MLVLSRRAGERIQIGEQIEVTVVRIGPGVVRIGIEAPVEMTVVREEIRPGFLPASRQLPVAQPDVTQTEIETQNG
ncbi:MAG TPA: carbon storage regulator [Pirellulales bacterium]|nr:carbon storage regulator [Pirellulales bacterium]